MNDRLLKAIQEYNKASKDYYAAKEAAEAAKANSSKLWDIVTSRSISKEWETDPDYNAACKASEAEKEARNTENLLKMIVYAASKNITNIASNIVLEAAAAGAKGLDKPTHYKAFKEAFKNLLSPDFYYHTSYYTFTITYSKGINGHNDTSIMLDDNCEHLKADQKPQPESDLKEIRSEARNAAKYILRLYKKAEELKKEVEEVRNSYESPIKIFIPYIEANYGIIDDYKFFGYYKY